MESVTKALLIAALVLVSVLVLICGGSALIHQASQMPDVLKLEAEVADAVEQRREEARREADLRTKQLESERETRRLDNAAKIPQANVANYSRLDIGMTFAHVQDIVGPPSAELSSNNFGGFETVMYNWVDPNGGNMTLVFQRGRLVQKSQLALSAGVASEPIRLIYSDIYIPGASLDAIVDFMSKKGLTASVDRSGRSDIWTLESTSIAGHSLKVVIDCDSPTKIRSIKCSAKLAKGGVVPSTIIDEFFHDIASIEYRGSDPIKSIRWAGEWIGLDASNTVGSATFVMLTVKNGEWRMEVLPQKKL